MFGNDTFSAFRWHKVSSARASLSCCEPDLRDVFAIIFERQNDLLNHDSPLW